MKRELLAATLILVAAIAFNLAVLWPEVAFETPVLNDEALHIALVARAADALDRGEDPTDPWVSYFVEGYPLFHYYQHLPHVATALLFKALGGTVPLSRLMDVLRLLLLSTFPLSIYWTGRRLGFAAIPSALGGLVSSLLATNGLYGLDWASYLWRGYGLYTQLWGMWLLGPALAGLWVTLRSGRAYMGTATLLAGVLLSHMVLGYAALLSGVLFLFLGGRPAVWPRVKRLLLVGLLVTVAAAYFLVPFGLDRAYMNRSVWEDLGKYNAYGCEWTLKALARGELLDYGRFPALTLLGALGLIQCVLQWRRDERGRLLVVFFLAWLLLYFGRPTWGVLLDFLPLSRDLHLHRLIALVHLGAIGLITVGATWLLVQSAKGLANWRMVTRDSAGQREVWRLGAAVVLIALLLPVYLERIEYAGQNSRWLRQDVAAWRADGGQLDALLADLRTLPPARVYAGRGASWGKDFKVGSVPVYAVLAANGFDNPGYLYHALSFNADIEGYLDESRPATFNLFNLGYAIFPEDRPAPEGALLLGSYGRYRLYQVPSTGYFDLVDSDITLYGSRSTWYDAARFWLQSGLVEARQHPRIVLGRKPAGDDHAWPMPAASQVLGSLDLPRHEACGTLIAEQVSGNYYYAELEAGRACMLMLKASYHPGWEVQVDGRLVQTSMLAPSFVGVAVQPGHHQVLFAYRPGLLRPALLAAGLLVLLLVAAVEWQRARLPALFGTILSSLPPTRLRVVGALSHAHFPFRSHVTHYASRITHYASRITPYPFVVLLFVLLAGLPLLQLKQMSGHDAYEYLPRTIEFFRGLSEGHVLPRWAPDLSSGYGQPFFLFNPPVIYYLASAFHGLGSTVIAGLNLACLGLLAVAGLGMYAYAREFYGRWGGAVAGAAYVMAPFTLSNLYVRQAMADYAAMAFLPWALWGLYRWAVPRNAGQASAGSRRRPASLVIAAGAIALIVLSSNPVALITVPVLALYGAFLGWQARSWRVAGTALLAVGLGLGVSAFFWMPALLEREWVHTRNLLSGYLNYRNHFVYLHQLVYSPWGYGLSGAGPDDGMSFALGPVHLALLGASLLLARRLRRWLREQADGWAHFWFFIGVLALVVFLVTDNSLWLWDGVPLLQYLEFPWRILILAAVATAFISAFPFLVIRDPRRRRWLLVAMLAGVLLTGMGRARPQGFFATTDDEFAPQVIAASGLEVTTAREYEPVWVEARPAEPAPNDRLLVVGGEMRVLSSRLSSTRCEWLIEADGAVQLQAAVFFYPGWRLTVDGEEREITPTPGTGLIPFQLTSGSHEVIIEFRSTPLRTWSTVVSVVAAVLLLAPFLGTALGRRVRREGDA